MFKLKIIKNYDYDSHPKVLQDCDVYLLYMLTDICSFGIFGTHDLSRLLDISQTKFMNIVKKYNAIYLPGLQQMIFLNREDGENTIKELEPFFLASVLSGTLSKISNKEEWNTFTKYHRSTRKF